jgi:membrane-associated phospholipid phosphatase
MSSTARSAAQPRPAGKALVVSLALLLASGIASLVGNWVITARFPDRPTPSDALFELLPYVGTARYVTLIALAIGFAVFVIYAVRRVPSEIPGFISVFAIMYLLRAVFMVLTPLASAHGEGAFVFPIVQYGMFPSGHTAAMLLLARFTDPEAAPKLRRALYALASAVWISLVLAHGHYSIDIVGGLLLAYFVEQEWKHGSLFGGLKRVVS